jgi:hypothetical protein
VQRVRSEMRIELRGLDVRLTEKLAHLFEPPSASPRTRDEVRCARVS